MGHALWKQYPVDGELDIIMTIMSLQKKEPCIEFSLAWNGAFLLYLNCLLSEVTEFQQGKFFLAVDFCNIQQVMGHGRSYLWTHFRRPDV